MISIPEHNRSPDCTYLKGGFCYWCCEQCNFAQHDCPGCGMGLDHNGCESDGRKHADCTV